jgi:carboxypeptidase Q
MKRALIALAVFTALSASDTSAQGRPGGPPQTPPPLTAEEIARLRAQLLQVLAAPAPAPAQPYVRNSPPTDPVILRMWQEGWVNGQSGKLLQVLSDSIGHRLTGSPAMERASAWVMKMYESWGIPARQHRYGTWNAYRRGINHIDLIEPRVRTLEGTMLAWSPGTGGRALEGAAVTLPAETSPEAATRFLSTVRGKWVLISAPRISCRMPEQWTQFGLPESRDSMNSQQSLLNGSYNDRVLAFGGQTNIQTRLKDAGALGVIGTNWSQYPGINKIFGSPRQVLPTFDLSCEDYGMVWRLAENNQGPKLRINADAELLGERPVWNTIAEIKGSEKPNEYIILSAHFDSWEGHSGLTDNGTGTMVMMEAMRILKATYPNPKRTILVGHWNGEEQGLNGSRAFVEDHPQIVAGVVAGFNQDNGTGRVQSVSVGPFIGMDGVMRSYLSALPSQITRHINVGNPSTGPGTGGSDHASWQCAKAPVFSLGALSWDYSNTTWHTNRDSFDKVVLDDLKNNATLVAMLAYMASEDPQTPPKYLPNTQWPNCPRATRTSAASNR